MRPHFSSRKVVRRLLQKIDPLTLNFPPSTSPLPPVPDITRHGDPPPAPAKSLKETAPSPAPGKSLNETAPSPAADWNSFGFPEERSSISIGGIVGIVVAVCFILVLSVVVFRRRKKCAKYGVQSIVLCSRICRRRAKHDSKSLDRSIGPFTLKKIKVATNNFNPANKIGEGGFGPVYKGHLPDGTVIAVKQLSPKSNQGMREFVNEVGMISAVQHPHLVKLHGCSAEGKQLLLVYEYMENNSLARALFGPKEEQLHLDWRTRYKICLGIARGLAYLHGESSLKIVHRDIKATNVLLDRYLNPKISDFGLARLHEEDMTHISTRIAGTIGYMAPEYASWGYLTEKADVYSFGVVLFELVCGRSNIFTKPENDERVCLLQWAQALKKKKKKGNLLELVDPRLGSEFNHKEIMMIINVAILCTVTESVRRPTMSEVVNIFEGRISYEDFVSNSILNRLDEYV